MTKPQHESNPAQQRDVLVQPEQKRKKKETFLRATETKTKETTMEVASPGMPSDTTVCIRY